MALPDLPSVAPNAGDSELPVPPPTPARPLRRLGPVLGALIFATVVCYGMLGARMTVSNDGEFTGLGFNLFLAWIPLGLSLLLRRMGARPGWRQQLVWLPGFLWMIFYPNCFYIVTDFVHLKEFGPRHVPQWFDIIMLGGFAFSGVFLGSLALYLLQLIVRERWGYRAGWGFAMAMLALASVGIYMGRFFRWNSWEVVTSPSKLAGQATRLAQVSLTLGAFSLTFFVFSLMAYLFVVGMARLHEDDV